MALEGTVKTPFGTMQKKTLAIAGVGGVGILVIVWYRSKQQANAAASTASTDTTGTTDSGIDPATGLPYSQEQGQGFADQLGSGGYYDASGNWIPQSQQGFPSPTPGPGSFTSNPQWVQYVEDYLVNTNGMSSADVGAAIGKYIAGLPVTSDQVSIITQAIAVGGQPPVAGNGGYPPNYHEQSSGPPPTTKIKVPNVVGMDANEAAATLKEAGFTYNPDLALSGGKGTSKKGVIRRVYRQNPAAYSMENKGSFVHVYWHYST